MQVKVTLSFVVAALALGAWMPVAQAGQATRYWDCCKPSGSWKGKAEVYNPVDVCKPDGVTLIPSDEADKGKSICDDGGEQAMCSCMQPYLDTAAHGLGYGFAAFATGEQEKDTECGCFYAEFEGAMPVTKLIFQVINTGSDIQSGNFDFAIPGGGMGAFDKGCPAQWKTPAQNWGADRGGVASVQECANLPKDLQPGCKFRFASWADNPTLKQAPTRVRCTQSLIDRSGCQRKDDAQQPAYKGQTDAQNRPAPDNYKRDRSVCSAGGKAGYGSGNSSLSSGTAGTPGSGALAGSTDNTGTGTGTGTGAGTGTGTGSKRAPDCQRKRR